MKPGSTYVDPDALDWSIGDDGFSVKLLYENPSRGERTLLMKLFGVSDRETEPVN